MTLRRLWIGALAALGAVQCRPAASSGPAATPSTHTGSPDLADALGTRTSWVRTLSAGCSAADLELIVPFYEGLRFKPAASALRAAKSEYFELSYPGTLSMPLVAWRCGDGEWTAIVPTKPLAMPLGALLRTKGDELEARMECYGRCTFHEVHARGDWKSLASAVAGFWQLAPASVALSSRYDRFHFLVRQWVAKDAPFLRTDWTADALEKRVREEKPGTIDFVFGLDPNEVDLEGHYFWYDGALAEIKTLVRASPAVAQFHWLNLRTYKYAIPNLGIERPPPPAVRAAAKQYADGIYDFPQFVFKSIEMCLGAEAWQASRFEEMKKLVDIGFKVIAFDEFPAPTKWGLEPCRAKDHMHKPNDVADEWRVTNELVRRLSDYAHAHGVLLASEEPSTLLFPFTSGYMNGMFNEPSDMYDHWQKSKETERIALFSTMFGNRLTPYTRIGGTPAPPKPWLVQEQISAGH